MGAPPMTMHSAVLAPPERRTLEAICTTLLPPLEPEAGDHPALFALDAATIGVAGAMEHVLATRDPDQLAQVRRLLHTLERPLAIRLLIGRAQPFSTLPQPERERALRAMATSRVPLLRTGFQGLKRLATLLFYSLTDAAGTNATWPTIGYRPSSNPPALQPLVQVTALTAPTTVACDVCVIGSGAGGSVVAAELAAAGKRVLVLEAGSGQQAPDFDQHEFVGMQQLYLDQGLTATRDLGVAILAGATLGGGTTVNWQTSLPPPDVVRDEWAERSGCPHFTAASFTHSLEAVMARLSVTTAESVLNPNNAVLLQGAARLGYHWTHIPRNAQGCDIGQCGYCMYGCRHGGKQSTARTYLHDAQRTGETTIIAWCRAERVQWRNGRVTGVLAIATEPATGRQYPLQVQAPVVVVAAGALHSPALLLRSGLELPALGRHLFLHPTTGVAGRYAARIEPWTGAPQTILCDEFARLAGGYGFRLETAPAHPGLLALAVPWVDARAHRRQLQAAAHTSAIIVLVRDRDSGRVRLTRHGRPAIDYRLSPEAHRHMQQGLAAAARVHLAAGAEDVLTLHTHQHTLPHSSARTAAASEAFCRRLARSVIGRNWSIVFSAHQMGTCRMGRDARSAVCSAEGEVFGVRGLFIADASAFPASSGVNPMITIMALAHHTAQRIKAQ